jgi:hypothetical protein
MIHLKGADDDFDVEEIRASGATPQRGHLPVAREVAADKMRVPDGGIDALSQLITRPYVEIVANEVAASTRHIAIKPGVTPRAGVAVEQVIKAVRAARKPIPAVAAIDTQVLDGLKLELDLWSLDDHGRAKPKNRSKRLFTLSLGLRSPVA